jgi:hypothetical protein
MILETLSSLLMFVLVTLFVMLLAWIAKRLDRHLRRSIDTDAVQHPDKSSIVPAPAPAATKSVYRERATGVRVPTAAPDTRALLRRRSPLKNLRDARGGIILMTLLGPCRALEPVDFSR